MYWYLAALKKYAVFSGRARRKEFWYFILFDLIIYIPLVAIDLVTGSFNDRIDEGLFSGIYILAMCLPGLAVSVRRLHDTDRSGWWLLINLVPLIGFIVMFVFMVQESHQGTNQYGSDPKGRIGGVTTFPEPPNEEFIALLKSAVNENKLGTIPDKDLLTIYQKARVAVSYDPALPKIINTFKDELARRGLDAEKKCPSCKMMVPDGAVICPCCNEKFVSQSQKTPLFSSAIETSSLILWSCITRKSTLFVITLLVLLGLAFIFRYDVEYIHGTVYRYDRFTSTVEVRRTEGDVIKWMPLPRFKNLQHVRGKYERG